MQGLIIGETSYSTQSLDDIKKDVENWINMSKEMKEYLDYAKEEIQKHHYAIPYDYLISIERCRTFAETCYKDLNIVLQSINNDSISTRDVNLLTSVGEESDKKHKDLAVLYNSDSFDNISKEEIKKLLLEVYTECNDIVATQIDAANAAERLKNYIKINSVNNVFNNANINIVNQVNSNNSGNSHNITNQTILNNSTITFNNQDFDECQELLKKLKSIGHSALDADLESGIEACKNKDQNKLIGIVKEMVRKYGGLVVEKAIEFGVPLVLTNIIK